MCLTRAAIAIRICLHLLLAGGGLFAPVYAAFDHIATDPFQIQNTHTTALAFPANPGLLSDHDGLAASVAFTRQWEMPELDRFELSGCGKLGTYGVGLHLRGFGRELYTEREGAIAVSHAVIPHLSGGVSLGFGQVRIDGYGVDNLFRSQFGVLYSRNAWQAGLALQNAVTAGMARFDGHPERRVLLHGRWSVTPTLALVGGAMLEAEIRTGWQAAITTQIWEQLALAAGYDTASERFRLGLLIALDRISASSNYDHHPWLGWSRSYRLMWSDTRATP